MLLVANPRALPAMSPGLVLNGRYRLVDFLARGGMAEVWEGRDLVLDRSVAVKILQPQLSRDELVTERFRREAVVAAGLSHPGVVTTYDTGIDDGIAYIVMELVRGQTLREVMSHSGPLPCPLVVDIVRQVGEALVPAHRSGLVHRDLKPANILVSRDEAGELRAKVTDFGIAKVTQAVGHALTRTGVVLGTPKYLSPEQVQGLEPDGRADLYSLGVVCFEMLTGRPPFQEATDMATAMARLTRDAPLVSTVRPSVPPEIDSLVAELLARDPAARLPSADVLCARLAALGRLGAARPSPPAPITARFDPARGARQTTSGFSSHRGFEAALGAPVGASGPTGAMAARATRGGLRTPSTGTASVGRPTAWDVPAGAVPAPPPRTRAGRSSGRRRRGPGLVVACLSLAAVVVLVLLLDSPQAPPPRTGHGSAVGSAAARIVHVGVFMDNFRAPDNPSETALTFDGNPHGAWSTDLYTTAKFGGLYSGEGLAIELARPTTLHRLVVASPTDGWSARTYVSSTDPPTGSPVSAWGSPTDQLGGIVGGASFSLGGRRGNWVLLWLTRLGPTAGGQFAASIGDLRIS